MSLQTTTHLNFRGDAREALAFYQSVFGGDLVAVTYADAHAVQDPAEADQIMWGQVAAPNGFRVMAFDVPAARPWDRGQAPFFISVRADDASELGPYSARLAQGAAVVVELGPAPWAPLYGMLTDRFGITWVLDVAVPYGG